MKAKEILYLVLKQHTLMFLQKGFTSDTPNDQRHCDAVTWWVMVYLLGQLCRSDHGHAIPGLTATATLY